MPTARQKDGRTMGRTALMGLLAQDDWKLVLRELLSSIVLKEDLKIPDGTKTGTASGTLSLPGNRETLFTLDGGMAIRLQADEAMAAGVVVTAGTGGYSSCRPHVSASKEPPIGVVYEDVSAGDMATIVVSGMARVLTADDSGGGF